MGNDQRVALGDAAGDDRFLDVADDISDGDVLAPT